jgi:hypothetical protein
MNSIKVCVISAFRATPIFESFDLFIEPFLLIGSNHAVPLFSLKKQGKFRPRTGHKGPEGE